MEIMSVFIASIDHFDLVFLYKSVKKKSADTKYSSFNQNVAHSILVLSQNVGIEIQLNVV